MPFTLEEIVAGKHKASDSPVMEAPPQPQGRGFSIDDIIAGKHKSAALTDNWEMQGYELSPGFKTDVELKQEFKDSIPDSYNGNFVQRMAKGGKDNIAYMISGILGRVGEATGFEFPGLTAEEGFSLEQHSEDRAKEAANYAAFDEDGWAGERVTRALRAGGESIMTGAVAGGVGGLGAMATQYAIDAGLSAEQEALAAKLSPGRALAHGIMMGAVEGGGTMLGSKIFGPGFEEMFTGKPAAGIMKAVLGELPEELGIESANIVVNAMNGVEEMPTASEYGSRMLDTAMATVAAVGMMGGSGKASNFLLNPSRKNAKELGLPPEVARSKAARENLADQARIKIGEIAAANPESAKNAAKIVEHIVKPETSAEKRGMRQGMIDLADMEVDKLAEFEAPMDAKAFEALTGKKKTSKAFREAYSNTVTTYRDIFQNEIDDAMSVAEPIVDEKAEAFQDILTAAMPYAGATVSSNEDGSFNIAFPGGDVRVEETDFSDVKNTTLAAMLSDRRIPDTAKHRKALRENMRGTYSIGKDGKRYDGLGLVRLRRGLNDGVKTDILRHELVHMAVQTGLTSRQELAEWAQVRAPEAKTERQIEEAFAQNSDNWTEDGTGFIQELKNWMNTLLDVMGVDTKKARELEKLVYSGRALGGAAKAESTKAEPAKPTIEEYAIGDFVEFRRFDKTVVGSVTQKTKKGKLVVNSGGKTYSVEPGEIDFRGETSESLQRTASKPAPKKDSVVAEPSPKPTRSTSEGQSAKKASSSEAKPQSTQIGGLADRFRGLANHAADKMVRQANYDVDESMGEPERKSWTDAHPQAAARINADPQGEIDRMISKINEAEQTGGTIHLESMTDMVVMNTLANAAAKEGYSKGGSQQARDLHRVMLKGLRKARSEQARILGYRDPLASNAKERFQRTLESAMSTINEETYQRVKADLASRGIDLDNIEALMEDPAMAAVALDALRPRDDASISDIAYEYWRNAILSGPGTHATNVVSNMIFAGTHMGVEMPVEMAINLFAGNPKDPSFKEVGPMIQAIMPGVARGVKNALRSWATERSSLSDELGRDSAFKIEGSRGVIRGKLGRLVRTMGFRPLMAADEFSKSITSTMMAAAHASRIASAEGLTGSAYNARLKELTSDFGSPAWDKALIAAETMAFQGNHGVVAQNLATGIDSVRKVKGGRWVVPFRDTPAAIFEEGLKRLPLIGVMVDYANARAEGKNLAEAGMTPTIARQIIGTAAAMALWDMVDDDEPFITGTSGSPGDRALGYRTVPPQSIRLFGDYYSYSRIEPFATMMATLVDTVKGMKEEGVPGAGIAAAKSLAEQTRDKTFLNGVSDVVIGLNDLSKGDPRGASIWAKNFASSIVPNIYRQTMKSIDPDMDESRMWASGDEMLKRAAKRAVDGTKAPGTSPTKRYDLWGKKIQYSHGYGNEVGDFLFRVLSPMKRKDMSKVEKMDMGLRKYNTMQARDKDKVYWKEPQKYFKNKDGDTQYLTDKQYEVLSQLAGERAYRFASKVKMDPDNPTTGSVEAIKKKVSRAHKQIRAKLKPLWEKGESGEKLLGEISNEALNLTP